MTDAVRSRNGKTGLPFKFCALVFTMAVEELKPFEHQGRMQNGF